MKVKGESEKAGLKFNIQKMKTMTSSPMAMGYNVETEADFIFWTPKSLQMVIAVMK